MAGADFYPSRRKSAPRGSAGASASVNDGHLLADAGVNAELMRADSFPLIVFPLPTAVDVNTAQAQERSF